MDRQQAVEILAKQIISDIVFNTSDDLMQVAERLEDYSLDNDEIINAVRGELAIFSDFVRPYDSRVNEAIDTLSS